MFASHSKARIMQLCKQVATIQNKNLMRTEYFSLVETLSDMLAFAGRAVLDDDLVTYLLTRLDNSYDSLVTLVTTRVTEVSVDGLFAHMLDYELRQEGAGGSYNISANSASRGGQYRDNGGSGNVNGGSRDYTNQGKKQQQPTLPPPRTNQRVLERRLGRFN